MTLRGEPTWGRLAAVPPVDGPAADEPEPARTAGAAPRSTDARNGADPSATSSHDTDAETLEDLEDEVYSARELQGDELAAARNLLGQARGRFNEPTYRRALVLARDTILLSLEECLDGARAMEWEPLPRPEFTLATIEAAVAEQERTEQPLPDDDRRGRESA